MKIAILSQGSRIHSTRRLREAALAAGHTVRTMDPLKFAIRVERGAPSLHYRTREVRGIEAVIPRIGASITFFGAAVVRQFEQMGVFCVNSSQGIVVSRDKLRAIQVLSRHDIGIPSTAFVREGTSLLPTIRSMGGAPVIIKLLQGTQGVGVILAETESVAEAIIETLHSTRQNVLIQRFVQESRGKDIRAFVVGGRVVAAMRRMAKGNEFRSNVHRGGDVAPIDLDPAYERTAIRAAQIIGLHVAGVDMLEGCDGPLVMEVNSSPGLEGIERATQTNVAGAIIEFLERQVRLPEIDLRQRLTIAGGYGVAEIPIGPGSPMAGLSLLDAGLRELDITVLSILRENHAIPNPQPACQILRGDILICFGKLEAMKRLMPLPRPRRRTAREADRTSDNQAVPRDTTDRDL
ncbi:MAG: RimK family alpha-L-glutamate ligase [Candidatus Schekmanbacteria bacterium]|nr:RimK family alpha-L-glutamate ligase [Candidatus Schekmanbacteria bacterium]